MKYVGMVFLAFAAFVAWFGYHFATTANFRTEGSPAGTAMLVIPLGAFAIAFFAGVIGLVMLFSRGSFGLTAEERRERAWKTALIRFSGACAMGIGLLCAMPFMGSRNGESRVMIVAFSIAVISWPFFYWLIARLLKKPDFNVPLPPVSTPSIAQRPRFPTIESAQSWLNLGDVDLGFVRLANGRCWLLLRGAQNCFRAQERGTQATGWESLVVGGYTMRIPKSWTLSAELAEAVQAAVENKTKMPDEVVWYTAQNVMGHKRGPWWAWSEVSETLAPQQVVRSDSVL